MDTSREHSGMMAETLIVLAGENAWSAARGFAQQSVLDRDITQVRYWRSVASGVLKMFAARLVSSAVAPAALSAAPAAPEAPAEMQEVCAAALAAPLALAEMHDVPAAAPAAPEALADTPEIASADSESAGGWKPLERAPIPLRARRISSLRATAPVDPAASASVESSVADELLVARAA